MIEVTVEIVLRRPAAEVFVYLADMSNNPRWQRGMRRCVWTSKPPHGVGSTYDQEARFLGRAIVSSFAVVEFEQGRLVRIRSTSGTMPLDITRRVEAEGSGRSRVVAVIRGDPGRGFRWAAPLLRRLVRASVSRDYRRLRALLEGRS